MAETKALAPASELARHGLNYPNESAEYRSARTALLAEEIELRRHIERVAEQRRALPPGGEVPEDYRFEGENGPVTLVRPVRRQGDAGRSTTTCTGRKRKRPCPMCTSLLSAWDGEVPDIAAARRASRSSPSRRSSGSSPSRRSAAGATCKLYSSAGNSFNRDYLAEGPEGDDDAAFNVFTRRDGTIRHFWGGEMGGKTADPGQDPRGAPDLMPLWTILDITPDGRGTDWYPKLEYAPRG